MARRDSPEINAGSMADIAFLLLIFFLVTTTMDVDAGISRKLPEKQPENVDKPIVKERNVFEVIINRNDDLLIENEYYEVKDVKELAIAFIDNGGGKGNPIAAFNETDGTECSWCGGAKDPKSSDHPNKAVISLKTDRSTSYGMYIEVQNEIGAAYTFLRNRLAMDEYGVSYSDMVEEESRATSDPATMLKLTERIKIIKAKYPEIIAEISSN
ncbi:MAG: biopolymer transporter ExbD [Urechidicola sp.]|nr:biopolymer transporter ExbD [Urechidicola sp.]